MTIGQRMNAAWRKSSFTQIRSRIPRVYTNALAALLPTLARRDAMKLHPPGAITAFSFRVKPSTAGYVDARPSRCRTMARASSICRTLR